jgi:hypothetical protein
MCEVCHGSTHCNSFYGSYKDAIIVLLSLNMNALVRKLHTLSLCMQIKIRGYMKPYLPLAQLNAATKPWVDHLHVRNQQKLSMRS